MAQLKINYGIDLGTTNSSICRMEKGESIIIKTDTLKDTLPSCVSINKNGTIKVGDSAYNTMKSDKRRATKNWTKGTSNTFLEFKRAMGTDLQYECCNSDKIYTPEQLSAEVLKTLRSLVTDEKVNAAVITVPAKFTVGQKTATIQAAKLAGIEQCELLQEPIAAAFAYGLSTKQKNGIWMVFDFGGGTFDTALLRVEDGILQVFDTAGDNYLGGKDLDSAIVEQIIIPYLKENYVVDGILKDSEKYEVLCSAMKTYAEEIKNQLSFKTSDDIISNIGDLGVDENGEEIELDITISQQQLFQVMRPIFQKSVDICKELLSRNKICGENIDKLILIGGPTYSPLIRQMLKEQITPNVDTSINPMTAVATGAALYASTVDKIIVNQTDKDNNKIVLDLDYEATSVETSEWVSIKLSSNTILPNNVAEVQVELIRSDHAWSSGKTSISGNGNVIEINLCEGKANTFSVVCYSETGTQLECIPSELTVIQGTKVGSALLPYNIGIATKKDEKVRLIFTAAKGLEKNKSLPATGAINGLFTSKVLRPGVANDIMTIPVYQCEDELVIERTASLYEYVADIVVTGEEVKEMIPEYSPVDITLKVDRSEQMTMEIYFPSVDFTVSKKLDTSKRQSIIEAEKQIERMKKEAQESIRSLNEVGVKTDNLSEELNHYINTETNNTEKKASLQRLKEILRKIENLESGTEWMRLEKSINEIFQHIELTNRELNGVIGEETMKQLRLRRDQIFLSKNILLGKEYKEQLIQIYNQHTRIYQYMAFITNWNEHFGEIQWADAKRARQLINMGLFHIERNPTVEQLHPIVVQLYNLQSHSSDKSFDEMGHLIKN